MKFQVDHPRIADYRIHRKRWSNCDLCSLHKKRFKAVLWRGTMPCDVLFIGEAPGPSEDIVGKPFVGPAGNLLDDMLLEACEKSKRPFTYAITNIVACYPGRSENGDFNRPTKDQAIKCRPRLVQIIDMAEPKAIVTLGKVSLHLIPYPQVGKEPSNIIHNLTHPASILRQPHQKQNLDYSRFVHNLIHILKHL